MKISKDEQIELLWCVVESLVKERQKEAIVGNMTQQQINEWCEEMEIDTIDKEKVKGRIKRLEDLKCKLKE